jgi:hypothetical protein
MQLGEQWTIYALAFAVGVIYAITVAVWRRIAPNARTTALKVVIGDALVAGFVWPMWGPEVAASLLALLALMGIPQIIGYHIDCR